MLILIGYKARLVIPCEWIENVTNKFECSERKKEHFFPSHRPVISSVSVKGNLNIKTCVKERSNFIRGSTEAGFRRCSAVNSQENTSYGALF